MTAADLEATIRADPAADLADSAAAIPVAEARRATGNMAQRVDTLDQLVEKLKKALGADLVSVILYGSAAAGDHQGKFSDINVLCLLSLITPVHLGLTVTVFRWWRELGNPSPLLLTEQEVQSCTDCFAEIIGAESQRRPICAM